ncbi:hypothetical protein Taro_043233, partial [Colocasia esculenta]|nr:hypothetical protein [Colocasia esculenta]
KRPLAQREAGHVDGPPIRKKSASKKKTRVAAPDPTSSYKWWSDFVHACGLPPDAPADSLLSPDTFSNDLAKEWIIYLSSVLTSLGPRREAFLVQRARSLDDVWSAVSSGARELGLFPQTLIPRPLESVLPSDTVSPRRLAQPETLVRPDISLPVPSPEAANSPRDGAGGATFSPHISMRVEPSGPVHAAPIEPLLSSLLSKDQNVEPIPFVSEAQGGHSREDDVDDWDYELDVTDIPILNPNWDPSMENPEDPNFSIPFADLLTMMEDPLPTLEPGALQDITTVVGPTAAEAPHFPFIEVVVGQGVLLPVPDPGETNNNGDDSSLPVPPTSNLPAAAKEVEAAIKSSAHISDMENSGMTSPLDDSEPDSSETCMISGPHSESTEPLSGETQQLSITFEAACDVDEVSSRPSPATS